MSGAYVIVSKLNNFALAPEGNNPQLGARVASYPRTNDISQQFYDDPSTGTIRCALNQMCLDFEGGVGGAPGMTIRLMPYQPGDPNQQWTRDPQGYIRNRQQNNKVIDIYRKDQNPGAEVGMWDQNGGPNQLWSFEFVGGQPGYGGGYPAQQPYPGQYPPAGGYPGQGYPGDQGHHGHHHGHGQPGYPGQGYPATAVYPSQPAAVQQPQFQRKDFYIISELTGKALDVKAGNKAPGAQIIMWAKKSPASPNQLWYKDQNGFLRSALNDFAIRANSGDKAKLEPYQSGQTDWTIDGNKIVNRANGEVLDVFGENRADGADVGSYKYHNKSNQHWKFEHV